MKRLKIIFIIVISLSAWPVRALPPREEMFVQRFTDLGVGEQLRWEVGTLFCSEGFIGSSLSDIPAEIKFALFTPEVLAAISGKFVITLEDYTSLSHFFNLECFTRSEETYSINQVAYVIVNIVSTSNIECLFNWAQTSYPSLFSPLVSGLQFFSPYNYRYYKDTNAYVGVSSANNHVYYLGPDGVLLDVGDLFPWLTTAGCQ